MLLQNSFRILNACRKSGRGAYVEDKNFFCNRFILQCDHGLKPGDSTLV